MLIVGEFINTSRNIIKEAIKKHNSQYIRDLDVKQAGTGAKIFDNNCCAISSVVNVQFALKLHPSFDSSNTLYQIHPPDDCPRMSNIPRN
jgi:hypothetical protein